MKFEQFLTENVYSGLQDKARKAAASAKDGTVKYEGETYTLKFDSTQWYYVITDSNGNFVTNLNTKSLASAKSELKKWLSS